jgi:hypothetical protein
MGETGERAKRGGQRLRARRRERKVVLRVEVYEVALVEALPGGGFLAPEHVDDRADIKAAVGRLLSVATVEQSEAVRSASVRSAITGPFSSSILSSRLSQCRCGECP